MLQKYNNDKSAQLNSTSSCYLCHKYERYKRETIKRNLQNHNKNANPFGII